MGYTTLNNFSGVAGIQCMSKKYYKKHEREVGPVVEAVAKESCLDACEEEKKLTLTRTNELLKRL